AEHDAPEYVYGEVDFVSFIALISLTKPKTHRCFYDLGSGIGKAVVACAMIYDMQAYYGVELLQPLHAAALAQKKRLEVISTYTVRAQKIHFIQDDFLKTEFQESSLIFIHATAFWGALWDQLQLHLRDKASKAIIITISRKLEPQYFEILHATHVLMSWGVATAYIQQLRLTNS
ncbi:MAG: hypothetical protein Q8R79_08175, partial [Legionellaceae bacterium]|nr:hypothetical protein [Legionellaceae bacterium]